MNTTLTPVLGRELTDDELTAFHGGKKCIITLGKSTYNQSPEVTLSEGCRGMAITINVTLQR